MFYSISYKCTVPIIQDNLSGYINYEIGFFLYVQYFEGLLSLGNWNSLEIGIYYYTFWYLSNDTGI